MTFKLKGILAEKFMRKNKEKKEKTLERMEKVRTEDNKNLRDTMTQKITWAKEEIQKGQNGILRHKENIRLIEIQIQRLQGMIIGFEEVLNPKEEPQDDNNKN